MKLDLLLIGITTFLIVNTYYDGKYSKMIKVNMKYAKMAFYGFTGLTIYLLFKKHPSRSREFLMNANDLIRYMPIDKNTSDIITPILDFTKQTIQTPNSTSEKTKQINIPYNSTYPQINMINKRMLSSGKQATNKRSVSETKKKYVASNQQWKCGHCGNSLDHTFEVDHIIDLQYGGDNSVDNLIALCRNCHGKKTSMRRL